jgi:hypothetical protein
MLKRPGLVLDEFWEVIGGFGAWRRSWRKSAKRSRGLGSRIDA